MSSADIVFLRGCPHLLHLCFMYSIICQVCDYLMHTVLITSCVGYSRRILGEKFVLDFLTRFKRHCLRNVRGFEGPDTEIMKQI